MKSVGDLFYKPTKKQLINLASLLLVIGVMLASGFILADGDVAYASMVGLLNKLNVIVIAISLLTVLQWWLNVQMDFNMGQWFREADDEVKVRFLAARTIGLSILVGLILLR